MRVCIPWPLSRLLREEHGAHYDEEVSIQNGKVRLPTDVTVPRHTLVAEALDELAWVWGGGVDTLAHTGASRSTSFATKNVCSTHTWWDARLHNRS